MHISLETYKNLFMISIIHVINIFILHNDK